MSRLRFASLVSIVALLTVGCGAGAEDEATSSDAITEEEAAEQLQLQTLVLKGEPANPASTQKLGITHWHVYVKVDDTVSQTYAFATDAARDVRYALVVDNLKGSATLLQYDKAGVMEKPASIERETIETLLADFATLRDRASSASAKGGLTTKTMGNGTECALRVAGAALAAAVAIGTISWVAGVGATYMVGANAAGFALSNAAINAAGVKAAGGAVAVMVESGAIGALIFDQYDRTKQVCAAAITR